MSTPDQPVPTSGPAGTHSGPGPQRIAVIGAGMVGLATAWFLQEHGVEVSVLERTGVAAGASWGNAGWLTPGITTPLPEPDTNLLRFVAGFTRNSTGAAWRRNMAS
jgi:D-amino-acid dehydrogenase